MKTLLCIHSYKAAASRVAKFWPSYKLPGWPILGCHAVNGSHEWPEGTPSIGVGRDEPPNRASPNLPVKLLDTIDHVLTHAEYDEFSHICIIEHDGIFIRQPEPHIGRGILTCLSGGCPPEWGVEARAFYHCPWWMDRDTARTVLDEGRKLLAAGKIEWGSPDIFIGSIIQRAAFPVVHGQIFSVNSGDFCNRREEAKTAIQLRNVWFVHGIKTDEEYDWVKSLVT